MKQINPTEKFARNSMRGIIIAASILLAIIATGIIGYMTIEHYHLVDAIYMTIITVATVGFGEVKPLSQSGMIFTTILIISSFGIYAYVISNFTRYVVNGVFRNFYKTNKVKKRINKLNDHVIVVGYGRNGRQTIEELTSHDEKVVLIEKNGNIIEDIQNETDLLFIHGDATQDEILEIAGISRAKALITALPVDADNLFVVLTARGLNSGIKIISRAMDEKSDIKLKRAGATNVIMPAKTGGQRMAKLVAQPDIVEFLDHVLLQSVYGSSIEEVSCKEMLCQSGDKTIRELNLRKNTGANIIGIRHEDGIYVVNPGPDVKLCCNDQIFVIGQKDQISAVKTNMCNE